MLRGLEVCRSHLAWPIVLVLFPTFGMMETDSDTQTHESSLLPGDLREVQRDIAVTVQSEMMLFESLLGTSIDASSFRERIQGAWSMVGVVSALILTMDQYNEVVTCPEEVSSHVSFCQDVHPLLSACSTVFAACSVLLSMMLYVEMSFVPDEFLGPWMQKLSWAVEAPVHAFIISMSAWVADFLWRGVLNYGHLGWVVAAILFLASFGVLYLRLKLKAMTNKFLLQAAAAEKGR
ncbi:unnamed protein product [Effrenium voratum]|nr:unnamed protein product [Effrenium voratum]